jgi:hypothetical protein
MVRIIRLMLLSVALAGASCQLNEKDDETRPVNGKDEEHQIPAAAKAVLEKAEDFELLSLEPVATNMMGNFHGWKVLGKTAVKDAETRKKLIEAFEKGVSEYKDGAARCFNPRHGIRVKHDGKTVEFVICFECAQVHVAIRDGNSQPQTFLISQSPAATFNDVLKKADIPLAEPPEGDRPDR